MLDNMFAEQMLLVRSCTRGTAAVGPGAARRGARGACTVRATAAAGPCGERGGERQMFSTINDANMKRKESDKTFTTKVQLVIYNECTGC